MGLFAIEALLEALFPAQPSPKISTPFLPFNVDGVYKTGFATTQSAYETALVPLFQSLDRLENILKGKTFLVGDTLTEADVRLFTTIVRFDPVYVGHFKCNIGTIRVSLPPLSF